MVIRFIDAIGAFAIHMCTNLGRFVLFLAAAIHTAFSTRLRVSATIIQMNRIGVESVTIVVLSGIFTGMAFALQSYIGFKRMGGEQFIGTVVALGMIKELGPVLTGLMVTGRVGSSIAAEIGTMRITEQIDALRTLCINTVQYLVVPRIVASVIILPLLTLFSMIFGIAGGYIICVHVLELSQDDYINSIIRYVELSDIIGGLIKAATFGLIIAWVGTYKGYHTSGGARGVGMATTESVVLGSILIMVSNYFLTKFIEQL